MYVALRIVEPFAFQRFRLSVTGDKVDFGICRDPWFPVLTCPELGRFAHKLLESNNISKKKNAKKHLQQQVPGCVSFNTCDVVRGTQIDTPL